MKVANKLKAIAAWAVRKLFPQFMHIKDLRHLHDAQLERMQAAANLTEEQWVDRVKEQYFKSTGHELNLDDPQRFSAKIQWRKLYNKNPRLSLLADKYSVRAWVKEQIGDEYLIPLLGVWERAEDIDFHRLPDRFVLKTNNASATNIVVSDKHTLNTAETREQLRYWLQMPFWSFSGEMHYKPIKPLVIAEENLLQKGMDDLQDYKFFCFDGKVFCLYVMAEYDFNSHEGKLGFFDRSFNHIPYYRKDSFSPLKTQIPKPANYEKMVELAEKLSSGFPHVRVDLYDVNGRIYFGEMTFTTASGNCTFDPDEFDYILGAQWDMEKEKKMAYAAERTQTNQ